ncbi:MAG: guanine deaminase [Acidobacteriota bacterium]|nr:guanine deaminase [Acidobacteriota bacterium]
MILYRAHLLWSESLTELRDVREGGLLVDDGGRIVASGSFDGIAAQHPHAEVQDLRPHWILPGLIDLHVHLPQYQSVAMDGLELLPWLDTHIFPAEARFADAAFAKTAAKRFFADLLSLGTTTAVVYSTIHQEATDAAFGVAENSGIRCALGKMMMDQNTPETLSESTETSLQQSAELIQQWHGKADGRLLYALAPRFAPMCSPALMRGVGSLSEKTGAYIQTHLAENLAELAWVKKLFPDCATYTEVYGRHGMLNGRTLLGHGIHLDESERALIRAAGASIVHCPSSNAFLQSGAMPLRRWLEEGLSMGLGTDVAGGPTLSLWNEMAMACTVSKLRFALLKEAEATVKPVEVFHLVTRTAAGALGLQARIGGLAAGMEADFIVVDPRRVDPGERAEDAADRVLSRLVYRADPRMVKATYVRGQRCFAQES